jgi:transcriptional regulator with XRE-family HTH domain
MPIQQTPRLTQCPSRHPNRIRNYRIAAGLSQSELGARIGRTRSVVSAWERGRYLPSVTNLFLLARALDTLGESLYWALYTQARSTFAEDVQPHS